MSQPFILPSNCIHTSANRCSVTLVFWYDYRNYSVIFTSDSLNDHPTVDNIHFIMIETAKNNFFSYDIQHVCKETDDCNHIFAEQKIIEVTKRSYNISNIYSDLRRLLQEEFALSKNLACFDMNDVVRQCTVPGMSGSCYIVDDLIKYKFHRRSCVRSAQESASVSIYDSGSFSIMTVKCNRMLCNGPLTMAAAKKILQLHNITDNNGRIPGSSSQMLLTRYLFMLTAFLSFRIK
jgi:hypothetical protein